MTTKANDIKAQENQAKFCQSYLLNQEKSLGGLCDLFASFTRKIARCRDKGDLVAKQLNECSKSDACGHSIKAGLSQCAYNMSAIQDHRQAEIQRLEAKVVRPLSDYGNICKQVKGGIKSETTALKKEQKSAQTLQKVRNKNPSDAHRISRAETELQKASADASIGSRALEEQIMVFERNRLKDLKNLLTDFVNIEMVFHAKALEYYTKCFESMSMVDEDRDLTEFARKLVQSKGVPRPDMTLSSLNSSTDYSDTMATGSSLDSSSARRRVQINENTSAMYGDDYDDDDDDGDEDDDDDDYDTSRR